YNDGIPDESRFATHSDFFKDTVKQLQSPEGQEQIRKVKELTKLAEEGNSKQLQTTVGALALAWVAKNPNTSTVTLGSSKPQQITENLKAIEVIPKLTPEIMGKIEKILSNAPEPLVSWRFFFIRAAIDPFSFSQPMDALRWTSSEGSEDSIRKVRKKKDVRFLKFECENSFLTCLYSCVRVGSDWGFGLIIKWSNPTRLRRVSH
ncbi:hypothetical protein CPC08DRAFT_651011, partial [Agrocybe pediades]